jgi:Tfp pilus assembly protein PilP
MRKALAAAALLLCSCGQDAADLKAELARARARMPGNVPPLPMLRPKREVRYEAGRLADPFYPAGSQPEPPAEQ